MMGLGKTKRLTRTAQSLHRGVCRRRSDREKDVPYFAAAVNVALSLRLM
jgi:hypothetical protein